MPAPERRHPAPSLAGRATLAVALLIGFYVFAIGVVLALSVVPFLIPHFPVKLLVLSLAGAAVIGWSSLPRIDRFDAPGPRLSRDAAPRLFEEIEGVAQATGQALPVDVYLVNEVNAFVTERGGVMGLGSKRVMGLGLPLMYGLTVPELRAVIAHEFGHFHGGDTKLGPWIYKTRGAIGRTIQNLAESGSQVLYWPFLWYGRHFMRVTQAVSRAQEFAADRLAAEVVGPEALGGGLKKLGQLSASYAQYMQAEFGPIVSTGHRPPLLAGYQRFLQQPEVKRVLTQIVNDESRQTVADPHDSHPPLAQRLEALAEFGAGVASNDTRRAVQLLDDVPKLEVELIAFHVRGTDYRAIPAIEWDEVFERLIRPAWEKMCRAQPRALEGWKAGDLASLATKLDPVREKLQLGDGDRSWDAEVALAQRTLESGLGLALLRAGWTFRTEPGGAVIGTKGDESFVPFGLLDRMAKDEAARAEWEAQCSRWGLADFALSIPG